MEYALVNILMSDELLNGWIGMMADTPLGPPPTVRHLSQTQSMGHKPCTPPFIYAQTVPCEACCRLSTSTENKEEDEGEIGVKLDSGAVHFEDEESEQHLEVTTIPKLNATSVTLPSAMQHHASVPCLPELTKTKHVFDPFETKGFKQNTVVAQSEQFRQLINIFLIVKRHQISKFENQHNSEQP